MIFLVALNQIYSLQNISDIVNAPFLNVQQLHCFVKVKALVFSLNEQADELFGKLN